MCVAIAYVSLDPPFTLLHSSTIIVPGIGSVTATVEGPGAANVTWTLGFSGGSPVLQYQIEYRRNDTSVWMTAGASRAEADNTDQNLVAPAGSRSAIVRGLEAEQFYLFRVAGSNSLGRGEYTESSIPLLSHRTGAPSAPSQPEVLGWTVDTVILSTTLLRLGSELNFSLGASLFVNGTEVSTASEVVLGLPENYSIGEVVELSLGNVSYRGDLSFTVFASNLFGSSPLSEPSLIGNL